MYTISVVCYKNSESKSLLLDIPSNHSDISVVYIYTNALLSCCEFLYL